jgi:two-component system invasion response regulator UvrY
MTNRTDLTRPPVSVLTVDDNEPFRIAARALLLATPGFLSLGEAASGEEAIALAKVLLPDLVLIDVNMPGLGGIETTRRLMAALIGTVVVLVSTEDDSASSREIASCGAAAFIRKQDLSSSVLRSLWACHAGGPEDRRTP